MAIFTGKMLAGEPAIVTGDGEQTRDFVDVGDWAQANYLAVTIDHQPGIHNLGWGRPTSINESFFALAKAAKELGWTPTLTPEQGLEQTVSYFRDSEIVL